MMYMLFNPLQAKADSVSKEDVFLLLKKAFYAQVSLSEKKRTMEEIINQLSPYFDDKIMAVFLEENLVYMDGKYITFGTDFPIYYVPYFSYSAKTKIHMKGDQMYVYEFFPKSEGGPVSYEAHYEGVLLLNKAGKWKITNIYHDFKIEDIMDVSYKRKSVIKTWLGEEMDLNKRIYYYPFVPSFHSLYKMSLLLMID